MRPVYTYAIRPVPPAALGFLTELAYNLWWCWHHDAIDLFRRIDGELWESTSHNPIKLLGYVAQSRFDELAKDEDFLVHLGRVETVFRQYMDQPRWFQREHPERESKVAYFSMEYGLARTLPVYSGGLGVLSGDHLKTASDLGVPLIGVGLAYRQGYFRQYLNADGWQQERYEENDFHNMPLEAVRGADGQRLVVEVPYAAKGGAGASVLAYVWRINVGRVPLYLLSTNVPENSPEDRDLTAQLYGGDREMRIRQEILLGIGGMRLLHALEIEPHAVHMNEGHSAFLGLERIRGLMRDSGLSYGEAYGLVQATSVFTTHTPVPAGNDVFAADLVERYLSPLAVELGLSSEQLLNLGWVNGEEGFTMPALAIHTSAFCNGVSRLHASVSRRMWQVMWPELPVDEVPIHPVTNGVHMYTWTAREVGELFDQCVGSKWREDALAPELWHGIHELPADQLWGVHSNRRQRLLDFARQRIGKQLEAQGAPPQQVQQAGSGLSNDVLTIGFARRFATYKRANLLLGQFERLAQLVSDAERPVQFIFAGKAHPHDNEGKEFIRELVHASRQEQLQGRVVFLEDYDLQVARYMVQGCDLWLNNPRRPLEASGTSGMKVVLNGGLHCSTLDGWWAQAYSPELGWAIGAGEEYSDPEYGDRVETSALFDLLEYDIVPLFYQRGEDGLPHGWINRMKQSMSNLIPRFCADRMVRGYVEEAYLPAISRYAALATNNYAGAKELSHWRDRVEAAWDSVAVTQLEVQPTGPAGSIELLVNEPVNARVTLHLNGLSPDNVAVEIYSGTVDNQGNFHQATGFPMGYDSLDDDGNPRFAASISSDHSGHFGLTVRVFPKHPLLPHKHALFKVRWK
jgi:starch phosphorylase